MTNDQNITCPSCGSQNVKKVLEVKDHLVSEEKFSIYHCEACTLSFTYPVPEEERIADYYQSENYISHTDTHKGAINKLYHFVRRYALKQKRKWVEKATGLQNGELLDIGCGTGAFMNEMKTSGWKVTGLEPDQTAREVAAKQYHLALLPSGEINHLPERTYDAITLWHVLEHVYPLHEYWQRISKLLRPDGKVFIALPNYTSFDATQYGSHWAAYDVPRHLYHFSPKAFLQLAGQYHFHCIDQIAMPFDAFYISLLSEKYQNGKTRYLHGFMNGLRSWLHAGRHPSKASAVLYVLTLKGDRLQ